MHPSNKKRRPYYITPLLAGVLVALVLMGAYGVTAKLSGYWPFSAKPTTLPRPVDTVDYSPATKQDNQVNEEKKSSPPSNETSSSTTPTAQSGDIVAQITNANTNNTSHNLHVGTYVAGTTQGTCTLTASMSGQTDVTKTAVIQPDASTYSCGAFNISYDEFPASGNWTITLSINSDGHTASDTWKTQVAITK